MKPFGRTFREAAFLALCAVAVRNASGFIQPTQPQLPNFDKRAAAPAEISPDKRAAAVQLKTRLPTARVDFDEITASPKFIQAGDGFLSGPNGEGGAVPASATGGLAADDPHRATKTFLQEHNALFGHGPEVLANARVKRDFVTPHNGVRTVVWEQQLDGIAVFEGLLTSHTTKNGELVNLSSHFVPDPAKAADAGTPDRAKLLREPAIAVSRAVVLAAENIGERVTTNEVVAVEAEPEGGEKHQRFAAPPLNGDTEAKLVWLPMNPDLLRLCWEVVLTSRARGEMFRVLIDAQTGEAVLRHSLTAYISDATYRVFTSDSPSPFSPGHPTPLTAQPPVVARSLVTLSALDTNASPGGWIDDGGNETRGNNVDAHTDLDNNNAADTPRPQGSTGRTFDFPLDFVLPPTEYPAAAVVQLFYWCNWMHDKLYELGFTEAAGNFQVNNFGRGGLGNDAVQADAQDGGGTDNANMSTPPDGSAPRMQMYLFTGPNPDRDGDYDAEVVLHEYTHGLSNRRVGGGVGISTLQSAGMGEGWSDFYGLALLSESGDDVNGTYAAGAYLSYLLGGLTQNYYFGIRRYPYSTDMSKNPLTFKDIDPAQASPHTGVPLSPLFSPWSPVLAEEVHNQGELWCVTLWEARANLINKYGFSVGNQLILQLVTDGMNFSPANPNFLQARDGILQADRVNSGGANQRELWDAFAKRGMGNSATSPSSSTTAGVHESFDLPDDLAILPSGDLVAKGPVGGPFTPDSQVYTLTNSSTNLVVWTTMRSAGWLNLSATSGTLTPGGPDTAVAISIDASANNLPMGIYTDTLVFSNQITHMAQRRYVTLLVGQIDYFTELFASSDNDLDFQMFTFTPDGSANYYSVCRQPANSFPTSPAGGNSVPLSDDSYAQVTLGGGATVSIYGNRTGFFFIGSNGYLTQQQGDANYIESVNAHFSLPRVAALFDDLNPGTGGSISWRQLGDRVAVTYLNVPNFGSSGVTNSFQIELFFDGRIRITYLNVGSPDGLAGVSRGTGVPGGFTESDFSAYGSCSLPWSLVVPAGANEDGGVLSGQGQVRLGLSLATNLTVTLSSSDTTEALVTSNVVVVAGQTNATFDLTVVDDAELDGTQTASIRAVAPGLAAISAPFRVFDNEVASLQVVLPPTVREGDAPLPGMVIMSAAPASGVVVELASSDTTEIQVTPVIVIAAGQTSAVFNVTVLDDSEIDGPHNVTVTARVRNWPDGAASVSVLDNEATTVSVVLPASAFETRGVWVNGGQLRLTGTTLTNLPVALASSLPAQLVVPATVTIPAGQSNRSFDLTFIDDPDANGDRPVTVIASAAGFTNGDDSLLIVDDDTPPVIVTQPQGQTVAEGQTVLLGVTAGGGAPLRYQWRFNGLDLIGATGSTLTMTGVTTNLTGDYDVVVSNRFGVAISVVVTLTVVRPPPVVEFRIASLTTNNSRIVDHDLLTGDDRGGIAAATGRVFCTGDNSTARFLLADLSGGTALGTIYDALVGDLQSRKIYSLADSNGVIRFSGGVATRLLEHDGETGALTTNAIPLTTPIPLSGNFFGNIGIFAGFGRVLVHTGTNVFDIRLPSGLVINLGSMVVPVHQLSETWAYWGVAEYFGGVPYLVYVRDTRTIVRTPVLGGASTPVATFTSLGDMAAITVSVPYSRWYFHFEGSAQFGGLSESIGFADATFNVGISNPPVIVAQPQSQSVERGGIATFSVGAYGSLPLSYQWWFSNQFAGSSPVAGATTGTLVLNDVNTNNAGLYWLSIANAHGSTNSAAATLTVLPGVRLAEALDGDGLSWSTSGNALWRGQTNVTHDGVDAAASGVISDNQQSSIQATVAGPGTLTFWWKVSSETGFDSLSFYRTDILQTRISGEVNWQQRTFNLPIGTHTLRWTYSKSAGSSVGQDQAWLDQVNYTPTGPPIITSPPQGQTVTVGSNATFAVVATGAAPLRYQWRLNSVNIPGATNSALTLLNVQPVQAGLYSVAVSNNLSSTISVSASLRVNRVPVAHPQSVSLDEDTASVLLLGGSDPDGDALNYTIVSGPPNGTLNGTPPNLTYRPLTNYFGPDSFAFRANDGRVDSGPATVSITVLPVGDPPVALPQSVTVNEDNSIAIILLVSDPDGDALTYSHSAPTNGTLGGTAPNLFYHPNTNYFGQDGFTFKANDGLVDSATALVDITVLPVNDAPIARASASPLTGFPTVSNLIIIALEGTNAQVVLDGSASRDVEDDPLTYTWLDGTNVLSSAVVTTNLMGVNTHEISLSVSDGSDTGRDKLELEIITPAQSAGIVIVLVEDSSLARRDRQPLIASLKAAAASFERGDLIPGVNQLQAFQNKVRAQVAPGDPVLADQLIRAAQVIIDSSPTR